MGRLRTQKRVENDRRRMNNKKEKVLLLEKRITLMLLEQRVSVFPRPQMSLKIFQKQLVLSLDLGLEEVVEEKVVLHQQHQLSFLWRHL